MSRLYYHTRTSFSSYIDELEYCLEEDKKELLRLILKLGDVMENKERNEKELEKWKNMSKE